ncbi:hypothetical protein PcP3B5_54760 [Pseudomonas citronellolis]|nr:hypothetical protein PcP3B5_54760 [Pseudomonas citronellolis]
MRERSPAVLWSVVEVRHPHPSPLPEGEGAIRAAGKHGLRRYLRSNRLTPAQPSAPNGPLSLWERVRVRERSPSVLRNVVEVRHPHPSPLPEGEGAVRAAGKHGLRRLLRGSRLTPEQPSAPNGPLSLWERVRVRERSPAVLRSVVEVRYPHPSPLPKGEGAVRAKGECGSRRHLRSSRLTPEHPSTPNGPLSLQGGARSRGLGRGDGAKPHTPQPPADSVREQARSYNKQQATSTKPPLTTAPENPPATPGNSPCSPPPARRSPHESAPANPPPRP